MPSSAQTATSPLEQADFPMSRSAKHSPRAVKNATPKLRPLEETLEWIRVAFEETLKRHGVRTHRLAIRLGVHRDTTLDWKSGTTPVNVAQVLRDDELCDDFLKCLHIFAMRARKRERRGRSK